MKSYRPYAPCQPYRVRAVSGTHLIRRPVGYTLLESLRQSGNPVPFLIYASSNAPEEHKAEARRRGALGSTNRPDELFKYVLAALGLK